VLRGFDDDRREGETADDAISQREVRRQGCRAWRKFREQQPVACYLRRQIIMFGWIDPIETAS